MTTDIELMQMALDALDIFYDEYGWGEKQQKAHEALRARLAQPEPEELGEVIPADEEQLKRIAKLIEPEPVAWVAYENGEKHGIDFDEDEIAELPVGTMLYTAPPQREWQGLTDEEAFDAFGFHLWPESFLANVSQELKDTHEEAKKEVLGKVRAIEAKLKEKNT